MRKLAFALLAPCVLLLTACETTDDPEDVDVPPAAERVQLQGLEGSGTEGEVAVTAHEDETHFVVEVRNAPANESLDVAIHSGTCQDPGMEIRDLGTIRTGDDGRGAIDTTVGEAPSTIMTANHIAVVWASLDRDDDGVMETETRTTDDATTTDATDDDTRHDHQTGLIRDDRRAIACTTLPGN